jgi:hypothetical protein
MKQNDHSVLGMMSLKLGHTFMTMIVVVCYSQK